jgi:exodeoxyribonuclease VIII
VSTSSIRSRVPREEYDAIQAISITRLKELRRSPQHYQYALAHPHPKTSPAMAIGTATHVAVLEPERYTTDFAAWDRRTAGGNAAPRNGQYWDAFKAAHEGQTILTFEENTLAQAIAKAVRFDENANKYLAAGEPEVTLEWEIEGRKAKGRVDWLTAIDGRPTLVGLKTSRDCRHFAFGSQAAKLGYHLQWSFYHDGFEATRKIKPALIEIVVESAAPHAVAVYRIPDDIIEQGRDEYTRLLDQLKGCEETDEWLGPQPIEDILTLPSWVYGTEADSELSELELTE